MKDQINTAREALQRLRHDNDSAKAEELFHEAIAALAQIEAAVGEPVAFVTDADVACFGKGAQGEIAALLHRQGKWCHPLFTAAPVAQQYEAGDMASAAAQGFRDGVASVTQQEPVAWMNDEGDVELSHKEWMSSAWKPLYTGTPVAQQPQADTCQMCGDKPHPGCNSEFQGDKACRFWPAPDSSYRDDNYWRGWNAAIRSQQPQAEPDIHEARGQIEFLDKKNNALLTAIHKVMARLADLLDEDQFKEIEDAISSAGVQPQAEAVRTVPVPDKLTKSDAEFWLANRERIIVALRQEGFSIVSTANGVRLMKLGKAEAQSAPQQAEAVPWARDDLDGMVEALRRVIEVHYNTKNPFHNPVYADARMAHRILVGYLPYMKHAAIAQQKGASHE